MNFPHLRPSAQSADTCICFFGISPSLFIPLPPLAEQKRIVAKIDQLMALCDGLEQGIEAATRKRSSVLGAVLAAV